LCAGRCAYAKGEEKQENNKNIGFKPLRTTAEAQERYKDSINRLVAYFNGNHTLLEERIRQDIDIAVEKKHFERAAKLRDALYALRDLQQPDSILERPHTGIWVHITTM
jgi:excinuclease UvrABC nuclease subunit